VAAQWKEVGVETRLVRLDSQIWTDKVYRKVDVSLISPTRRSDPTLGVDRSFLCNEGHVPYTNPSGYCNPELDRIAREAVSAPPERRRALYKQYAEIVARDLNEADPNQRPDLQRRRDEFSEPRRALQRLVQRASEPRGRLAATECAMIPLGR
jgi:peptide/nickel transport system substrate-binding protein